MEQSRGQNGHMGSKDTVPEPGGEEDGDSKKAT